VKLLQSNERADRLDDLVLDSFGLGNSTASGRTGTSEPGGMAGKSAVATAVKRERVPFFGTPSFQYWLIGRMLRDGLDVYVPLVDDFTELQGNRRLYPEESLGISTRWSLSP
jgi:hypothetical protein